MTKKEIIDLQEQINALIQENISLKQDISNLENNYIDSIKSINLLIEKNSLEVNKKIKNGIATINRNTNRKLLNMSNLVCDKIDNLNKEDIKKINEEIFAIINLMNQSMFIEFNNRHKDDLDNLFDSLNE